VPVWSVRVLLRIAAFAFCLSEARSAEAVEFYGDLLFGWCEGVVDVCFFSDA